MRDNVFFLEPRGDNADIDRIRYALSEADEAYIQVQLDFGVRTREPMVSGMYVVCLFDEGCLSILLDAAAAGGFTLVKLDEENRKVYVA